MNDSNVYLLAGLGFDYRIFENLKLKTSNINYLTWLEPYSDESLDNYVMRMAAQVDGSKKVIFIGHSFGGIIVQEISKIIKAEKVIIISSIKSKNEIPITLKFLKRVPLFNFLNRKMVLATFPIWARTFGYNSEKGRILFIQMISNCTDNYFRWAMDKIVNWNGNNNSEQIFHIHGTNDKTFSVKKIRNPIIIPDGSHFMVHSKAEEVSEIINRLIKN